MCLPTARCRNGRSNPTFRIPILIHTPRESGFCVDAAGLFLGVIPCGSSQDGFGVAAIGIDVAYQGIFYQSRGISNNEDPRVRGVWDTTIHVGALNLRVNFDAPRSF